MMLALIKKRFCTKYRYTLKPVNHGDSKRICSWTVLLLLLVPLLENSEIVLLTGVVSGLGRENYWREMNFAGAVERLDNVIQTSACY